MTHLLYTRGSSQGVAGWFRFRFLLVSCTKDSSGLISSHCGSEKGPAVWFLLCISYLLSGWHGHLNSSDIVHVTILKDYWRCTNDETLTEESVKVGARLGLQGWQCLCEGIRVRGRVLAYCTYTSGEDRALLAGMSNYWKIVSNKYLNIFEKM